MVGTTSEAEVPESRTEFNTDGSVELPSVNRLKALFSGNKDDMLGDGNFKRVRGDKSLGTSAKINTRESPLQREVFIHTVIESHKCEVF